MLGQNNLCIYSVSKSFPEIILTLQAVLDVIPKLEPSFLSKVVSKDDENLLFVLYPR